MGALSDTLLQETDAIVERWYETIRSSPHPSRQVGEVALKDLLPSQLKFIGQQLRDLGSAERPGTMWKITERLAPEERVAQEMPIEYVVLEYGLAVDTVREWIDERQIDVSFREYSYFYQAMFELVAEAIRRYAAYRTEQLAKQRAEYLAGLTHQMRTPLSVLALQVQLLEKVDRPPDAGLVVKLRRNLRRLSFLVNGVMRLERFKPDEMPVQPEVIQPARLVAEVMSDNEPEASRKGLRFEAQVNWTLRIEVDPDLFMDALGNLVHNAVKYTTAGFVCIESEEHADDVVFRIRDSGPGMPAERLAELFRPVLPGMRGGAGLGLVVAHHAVVAQGGAIGAESEPGKGTVLWFRLPRTVSPRAGAAP
jgi:two-component system sensor histidine kinase SenX3